MTESRMTEVATELQRLSREGKLAWENDTRPNIFRVILPDAMFKIGRVRLDHYRLELVGESGYVVDFLESVAQDSPEEQILGSVIGEDSPFSDQHLLLRDIHDLAEGYVKETAVNKALQNLKQAERSAARRR